MPPDPPPPDTSPGPPKPERAPSPQASRLSAFFGALFILAPLMPGLVAVISVGTYLVLTPRPWSATSQPLNPTDAIVVGIAFTAGIWILAGIAGMPMVAARRAQTRLYADLLERYRSLRDRVDGTDAPDGSEETLAEATTHLDYVHEQLEGNQSNGSLRWAFATGYLEVLSSLHRAEEALIIVEPEDAAVGDALHDALSLEDSTIDNRERLAQILRAGLDAISPASAVFLVAGTPAVTKPDQPMNADVGRQALREVRYAINQFLEDKLGSLLRARNRLIWTMLAVGVSTYLLLALALGAGVAVPQIIAVSVFYLVGAIIGLFNRLRLEVARRSAVEDFGLSMARLIVTPLLSGLAAVAGVYLVAVAPSLFPTAGRPAPAVPTLTEVFDLGTNAVGLVYAAIFGFAPNTLTNRLAAASARVEAEIASVGPATGTSPHQD